ncbi:deoxyguanosinetriphosphate triphosphohydrolase [Emticicia oligotrophica DSM 17448]|uniref:Deoxyguanosinetriphosphate triphosphohydrolase n=1 Tax=Emticicia oligotrophica (strain DSM 17448 / CIP 109782 / MTCC 6937 / GPTSA100-15) TaxID=929562 RepID=A0ABM5N1I7_EMTOG|nr:MULTISPECIES: deoxyguanosinetriphosphate triphosphohydrolase [Emticicia]AFK03319.1 deoxyguanosinetriphosphate triphosphohydrolase [Emticicia oligotrophica DSM 17448]
MNWQTLFSNKRLGAEHRNAQEHFRTDYMRDYDRLIFSSQFRRLQNKTQVFPLPGAVFVHNRLTHSLEVASVGRSLGKAIGEKIVEKYQDSLNQEAIEFYKFELSAVVMTACIAHDIGNPPFGHSGEEAIRTYFRELEGEKLQFLTENLTENQFNDFKWFEGNANAFRILTTIFNKSSLNLTYATLASIIKYPADSSSGFKKKTGLISTKKSGFFDSESEFFRRIATELSLHPLNDEQTVFARHPFVFLVEAADDICYRIIDLEDAHRLNIISIQEARELLEPFFETQEGKRSIKEKVDTIEDDKQKLSFLRAMLIGKLVNQCTEVFFEYEKQLLDGTLNKPLIDLLDEKTISLIKRIDDISVKKIYNHKSVIEIEIAGYHVIGGLLKEFVSAVLSPETAKSRKLLQLMPSQFEIKKEDNAYQNILSVVDFISGMTDVFAIDLYRKITGIQIPQL